MAAAHQEGLPKETNFKEDYPDRGSALHLNNIPGHIYTPAGLPADSAFGPAVTLSDTPNKRARLVGEITQVEKPKLPLQR